MGWAKNNLAALIVAVPTVLVLILNIPAIQNIQKLGLNPVPKLVGTFSVWAIVVAATVLLVAMILGITSDWGNMSKGLMMLGGLLTIAGALGAIAILVIISFADSTPGGKLLLGFGSAMAFLAFSLPAAIALFFATPGKP